MDVSSRWYKAAGASVIAGAITARYVAKWKRARSLRRRSGEDRSPSAGRHFIGLDLTDPFAKNQRPCDVAVLDPELRCEFSLWDYREDGGGIVPMAALGHAFMLAIDGPQGLAGVEGAVSRKAERVAGTPGHTPYTMPVDGKPYSGFLTGSAKLFHRLVTSSSRFRLLGMDHVSTHEANLMEVFPGAGWKVLTLKGRLPRKNTVQGREARQVLLQARGVQFPEGVLPTDDQLDAAMAAWTAYLFNQGQATIEGSAPWLDNKHGVIREGYIVEPVPLPDDPSSGGEEPVAPTG